MTTEFSCPECQSNNLRFYPKYWIACVDCGFEDYEEMFMPAGVLLAMVDEEDTFLDHADDDGPFGPLDDEYAGFVDNEPPGDELEAMVWEHHEWVG